MAITAKQSFLHLRFLQSHFSLTDEQFGKLLEATQLDLILQAMEVRRLDQATLMMYQDGILERKT